jgi:hypothetical protein
MVLAQQFTRHIAGWSAFARKYRQALLSGRDAFAHLDQAIHLPKFVASQTPDAADRTKKEKLVRLLLPRWRAAAQPRPLPRFLVCLQAGT